MTIVDKFLGFNENLVKKYDSKEYSDLLNKEPFEEIEEDIKFSSIHDLIDGDYLKFISLDIGSMNSTKYTVHFSDKALNELEKIKST
ncbi:MAG: hypothetical protein OCD02_08235 [Spirochaetaceae bacterium]